MFILYNLLLTLLAPLWVPWMLWRARARKEAPNWAERQGNYQLEPQKGLLENGIPESGGAPWSDEGAEGGTYGGGAKRPKAARPSRETPFFDSPQKDRKRVWLHAVSVGEVVAAMPVLKEIRAALPDYEILLSTTTSSGHQTARDKASGLYDHLVYFPIDVVRFQLGAMQKAQPAVVAIMETELWMNFLWAAKVFDARTMLINGRISDRSFPRSMKLRFFYRALLKNVDRCLMQSEKDRDRIIALGAADAEVFGNCKFDEAVDGLQTDASAWRTELGIPPGKPVVVIGSTRGEDEEDFVLTAIEQVGLDRCNVVHAPRHLERVPALEKKVQAKFGQVALRSRGDHAGYLILDTYGELAKVYAIADIVVVGGGFSNLGGQNLLQPLAHGKPVLHGPHMQNFREVAEAATAAGASQICSTPTELAENINRLLDDPAKRQTMGQAAAELVQSNIGASHRYAQAIAEEATKFHQAENARQ